MKLGQMSWELYNRLAWEGPRIKEFVDFLTTFFCIVSFCRAELLL